MKCALVVGAVLALSYPLVAQPPGMPPQSQTNNPSSPNPGMGGTPGMEPGTGRESRTEPMQMKVDDKTFLKHAATADLMQVELGKLAADKGSSDAVRQLGRKVADERAKTNSEVQKLAAKEGVTVTNQLDAKHQGKVDKLAKLDGPGFDKAFLKEQTRIARDDISEFKAEAQNGSNPEVKSFATRALPMIQAHEQLGKDLEQGKPQADQSHH